MKYKLSNGLEHFWQWDAHWGATNATINYNHIES